MKKEQHLADLKKEKLEKFHKNKELTEARMKKMIEE